MMTLSTNQELIQSFKDLVILYNQLEQTTLKFGTDTELHPAEIDTIDVIGKYPFSNLTSLANYQGVTRGTASKMIQRLEKKQMVIKQKAQNSDKELQITLTEKGKIARQKHQEYVFEIDKKIKSLYDPLPDEFLAQLLISVKQTKTLLKNIIQQRQ
ncbi:hypothetical protein FC89_GL000531 [Liquorilactobacillus ghanensis DSM 18630]|uniref:HTH marR-type domain-containing protein n=1 Tax=Liquorilactobacillus ghanensis DSM 18630 TaxID=1423750 RepID=A0A0R1VLA2_9LACO|nr:MarR family transcriptional regulator [Liquorilactobacillus ghanensis]KRM06391.1 hypothetical protein FC89_GL000531 [Liquorilactobacillus ghanensis DSM 18630]